MQSKATDSLLFERGTEKLYTAASLSNGESILMICNPEQEESRVSLMLKGINGKNIEVCRLDAQHDGEIIAMQAAVEEQELVLTPYSVTLICIHPAEN